MSFVVNVDYLWVGVLGIFGYNVSIINLIMTILSVKTYRLMKQVYTWQV